MTAKGSAQDGWASSCAYLDKLTRKAMTDAEKAASPAGGVLPPLTDDVLAALKEQLLVEWHWEDGDVAIAQKWFPSLLAEIERLRAPAPPTEAMVLATTHLDPVVRREANEALDRAFANRVVECVLQDVSELPDRTSPNDAPEMMLVTGDELADIIRAALTAAQGEKEGALAAIPAAREPALEEAAKVAEDIWDHGKSGAHGGEQANRTAAAIRALKT